MFKDLRKYRLEYQKTHSKALQLEMNKIEKKIEQLLARIVGAESTAVVSAYEKRIGKLQLEKQIMQKKVANCDRPLRGFDESFRTAMDFLANLHELWASGCIEDRHAVMKLTFAGVKIKWRAWSNSNVRPPRLWLPASPYLLHPCSRGS